MPTTALSRGLPSLLLLVGLGSSAACGDDGAAAGDAGPTSFDAGIAVQTCSELASVSAGVTTRSIVVAGVDRSFELSIPPDYDATKKARLVFGWHGLGGDGALLRSYTDVEGSSRAASGAASIFVYPNGLFLDAVNATGWEFKDTDLFDAIVAELGAELCIDESRVFSYGHSFGGYFSNSLGCLRGDAVRAIAPVAGGWPAGMGACGSSVPALLAHASDDAVVAVGLGQAARDEWLERNQCAATSVAVEPSPCQRYGDCQSGAPVIWCEAATGGHAWPGYANTAIWEFFASFDAS